jgi:hypothetical protein
MYKSHGLNPSVELIVNPRSIEYYSLEISAFDVNRELPVGLVRLTSLDEEES